jgi:hypothetical protein
LPRVPQARKGPLRTLSRFLPPADLPAVLDMPVHRCRRRGPIPDRGHMLHAHEDSLKQLHDRVADFIKRTGNAR